MLSDCEPYDEELRWWCTDETVAVSEATMMYLGQSDCEFFREAPGWWLSGATNDFDMAYVLKIKKYEIFFHLRDYILGT